MRTRRWGVLIGIVCGMLLEGCGDGDTDDPSPRGVDAEVHAGDAGIDVGEDASSVGDVGSDVGIDVGIDVGVFPPEYYQNTVVSLAFDDSIASQFQARDALVASGLHATFYLISGRLSLKTGLSLEQIQTLAADGNEIGSLSRNHLMTLGVMTPAEQQSEICGSKTDLEGMGFTVVSFAYPYNVWNEELQQVVSSCGFTSGRRSGGITPAVNGESMPPLNPMSLRTVAAVLPTDTLEVLQRRVIDSSASGKNWIIFIFHDLCTTGCNRQATPPETFRAFVEWLAANKVPVKTIGEQMGAAPQGGEDQVQPPQ